MAPEIPANHAYDPQKADVWSLAIIYCCMILGRFPWKSPDRSNESFCLFAAMESPKTQLSPPNPLSRASSTSSVTVINVIIPDDAEAKQGITEKVLGPWGLLRQLPAESREVIKAMLSINPSTRPTLEQVMKMPWIAQAQSCSEDVDGTLHAINGHRHS
jgi:serine/threonine protein kinase